jgi:hypothetical protein
MRRSLFVLAAVATILWPSLSAAQSEPAKLTVGFGAGTGKSALHDDASGTTWETGVRIRMAKYFGVELGVNALRTSVEQPQFGQTTRSSTYASTVNGLGMATFGRVTVSGGGGVGTAIFDRTFTQVRPGCEPGSSNPACQPFENHYSNIGFRFQGLVGADVDLGARLQGFAVARFGVNGGYVDRSIAGGVRVILKR